VELSLKKAQDNLNFTFYHNVQTGSGAHPSSCPLPNTPLWRGKGEGKGKGKVVPVL